jgi:hypothetical protein
MSYVGEGLHRPPARPPRNRFSLTEFELPPLQDPREAWGVAFPVNTPLGGRYFSASDSSTRTLIAKSLDEDINFPEGGRQAWLVVFGSWCALFSSLGLMNTMGAFEQYISAHQLKDLDVSTVGWIFSLYAFLTFGVGLFVGPLFDKYGPKWLIISGSVLVVLSMDMIGNCTGKPPSPCTQSISYGTSNARIMAIHNLLLHSRRHRLRPPLLPLHRHCRPLLQPSSRLRNWHSSYRWRLWRNHLPPSHPTPHAQNRLPLVHKANCTDLPDPLRFCKCAHAATPPTRPIR